MSNLIRFNYMIRVSHLRLVIEKLKPAGYRNFFAGRKNPFQIIRARMKENQLNTTGFIFADNFVRLAAACAGTMLTYTNQQGGNAPGFSLANFWAVPTINYINGKVPAQVQHFWPG
ncbi:hypothetical protein FHR98_001901 [Limibacillus halophilus]|uniref:Uncharacterized protein n=1 Tax=Limibacillus halophilus TaxID=1579333 RepID=A0A839SV75_9PROT|nr:hypothetical protein [Limibacillus halophilus]